MKVAHSCSLVTIIVVAGSACATVHTESSVSTTIVGTREIKGMGRDRQLNASVAERDSAFSVTVSSAETCSIEKVNVVRRTRLTRRSIENRSTLYLEYGLGGAALLGGLGVTYDAGNVPTPDDPMQTNPIGRTGAYGVGIAFAVVGIAGLVAGIHDTRAARDTSEDDGEDTAPIENGKRDVACNQQGASAIQLQLRAPDTRVVELGTTGSDGKLHVDWQTIPQDWLRGSTWVQRAELVTSTGAKLAWVPLQSVRTAVAERAWLGAQQARSSEPIKHFREDFAESHPSEATKLYAMVRLTEIEPEVSTVLGSKDLNRAAVLLEEWAALEPDSKTLAARRSEFMAIKRDVALADYGREFDAALAKVTVKGGGVSIESFKIAEQRLGDLGGLTPPDPKLGSRTKQLEQLRRRVLDSMLALAGSLAARGRFDDAFASLDDAAKISQDDARISRTRSTIQAQQDAQQRKDDAKREQAEARSQKAYRCWTDCRHDNRDEDTRNSCARYQPGPNSNTWTFYSQYCEKVDRACARQCGCTYQLEPYPQCN